MSWKDKKYPFILWILMIIFSSLSIPCFASDWRITAQTVGEAERIVETIASTLDHLRDSFPNENFILDYADNKTLKKNFSISRGSLFITDALSFAELSQKFQVWAFAAMKHPLANDASHTSAAVFITRSDRGDLNHLKDLEGKGLIGAEPEVSPSFLMGIREISRFYGDKKFFKSVRLLAAPVEQVVHEILSGNGDVGIIDSCLLERMIERGSIPPDVLKTIGAKGDGDLKCAHSTDLYPGWVFAVAYPRDELSFPELQGISNFMEVLKTVPQLVTTMEWVAPTDNSEILKLKETLDNLATNRKNRLAFVEEYRYHIYGVGLLILFILTHSLYAGWQVRRKTRQLRQSIQEKAELEKQVSEERERMSSLEKAGVVSQLSSLIAHELQQPLNSIVNYARGLRVLNQTGRLNESQLQLAVNEICNQGVQAASIVNRVRSYAKKHEVTKEDLSLVSFIEKVVEKFKRARSCAIPISVTGNKDIQVEADPLELELLVVNLLKNSREACSAVNNPRISISVREEANKVYVEFVDNGPVVALEKLCNLFKPGMTTKADGLGLGLSLCQKIAEAHGGNLHATQDKNGSLVFTLHLPIKSLNERKL